MGGAISSFSPNVALVFTLLFVNLGQGKWVALVFKGSLFEGVTNI